MTYKHGVYTQEQATSLVVPIEGTAGLQVVFGTAPKAAANPVLCYSFDEAKEALGYSDDWKKYTLCEAMKVNFDLFNVAPVIFVNVLSEEDASADAESGEGETSAEASDIVAAIDSELRKVYPLFGMTAGLISAPGWSHETAVATKLQSACTGVNGVYSCECLIDIPATAGMKYSDAKTKKESAGVSSAHALACWPLVKSGETVYHASAVVGALLATTDANNGDVPCLSPSNKAVPGITGLCLEDGSAVLLDQEQANLVNSYGVVTFLNRNGFRCWGNNTAVYPAESDPKDRWIMCRRFFTWRSNSLINTYFQKVDNPANYRLIEAIVDSENINGNSFVARDICAGYKVQFLSAENPITKILDGEITFHIMMAPWTPAEQINFVLEFDPTAISDALGGE